MVGLTAVKMDFRANTGPYGNHSLTVPCNGTGAVAAVISVR
ncbi:selenate reductase subunit YgfN [Escherichia coli]|uniref:Selenate reductase subunit YgfN n=1 Tax=Escherichia coli TaxID=562 RepID=A0A376UHN6_ECOLX|nr:selenate reductase subunit YgfN [Escherichia coli]